VSARAPIVNVITVRRLRWVVN